MDDLPNFFFVVDVDRKTPSLQVYPQLDHDRVCLSCWIGVKSEVLPNYFHLYSFDGNGTAFWGG